MIGYFTCFLGMLAFGAAVPAVRGAGRGHEVVVIYNTRLPESKEVAEHYAQLREVPLDQMIGLDLPSDETISRKDFNNRLEKPLLKALEKKHLLQFGPQIISATNGIPEHAETKATGATFRYLALCYGVPLHIAEDADLREEGAEKLRPELRRNEAAVDSELACLPIPADKLLLAGPRINPFYDCTNSALLNPTNGILLVARLDGPTAAIARDLVDKAIQAETDGLWGRAYFDLRGLTNGEYKIGDDSIRAASEICRRIGFETVVDYSESTFPANFPLSQVAFYAGWYNENVSGPFARPTVEFMPGAFAYHLHSFSANTLRSTTRAWVGPLLAKGATATMGCVAEPYLVGTPDMSVFFARFIGSSFTFGEAAYASQRFLSWQTTVVGDPLYRPFAKEPQTQHLELEQRHSKLIEWSYLRLLNCRLLAGTPRPEIITNLANFPFTHQSSVLMEKLADMYSLEGNTSASVSALHGALKLDPTPQQQVRIMLMLADRLLALQRDGDAYQVYRQFLDKFQDYPDELHIFRRLLELARKLGKKEDAENYEHQINRLTAPPVEPPKTPPLRHGL